MECCRLSRRRDGRKTGELKYIRIGRKAAGQALAGDRANTIPRLCFQHLQVKFQDKGRKVLRSAG